MKKSIRNTAMAVCIAALSASLVQAKEDLAELQTASQQAISAFQNTDPSMSTFFANSAGYAVFPSVGKGGLIVGGARGQGLVYQTGNVVGQATMTQATIGAQIGGQSFSEIIFFENPTALQNFKSGTFEMTADVSAVAASSGASKSARYSRGVAVFTMARKGLMAQAAVGGQKFKFEPVTILPTGR